MRHPYRRSWVNARVWCNTCVDAGSVAALAPVYWM